MTKKEKKKKTFLFVVTLQPSHSTLPADIAMFSEEDVSWQLWEEKKNTTKPTNNTRNHKKSSD